MINQGKRKDKSQSQSKICQMQNFLKYYAYERYKIMKLYSKNSHLQKRNK